MKIYTIWEWFVGSIGLAALLVALVLAPSSYGDEAPPIQNQCTPSGTAPNRCSCGGQCVQGTQSWQCAPYVKYVTPPGGNKIPVCACSC